ncbi:hypothetical protein [Pseudomonas auratipiscis]|uniref:Uncharacterized protein n=1 Tax=Pseudomonas auratipiscis TaxID=3115853 RepID=A0AB35WV33_9PSED|nr:MULTISPECIES: hypothetical protein [unclassified Pseudomonas]MEE1868478.1 hypothetical protein [Pseudomonas sp. 120P]MEE1960847.1 hypothetical protein [Pseudomonas sp. 119P]
MSGLALRAVGAGLLIALGMVVGTWASTGHFRPLLDEQQDQTATCKAARDNLSGLAAEQGKALSDLVLAGSERQVMAELAMQEATARAQDDFTAANRLQQDRTGGDQCSAAASVIDRELGL